MRPTPRPELTRSKRTTRKDSAYFIFDKKESLRFRTNLSHVRMKHGATDDPIYAKTRDDYMATSTVLLDVYGPVIDMVDYFMEGAVVVIPDTAVAVKVYERIDNHLDAHISAMIKYKMYNVKEDFESFTYMTEFALSLWQRVNAYYKSKGKDVSATPIQAMLASRPTFMLTSEQSQQTAKRNDPEKEIPPILEKYNRLERLFIQDRGRGL